MSPAASTPALRADLHQISFAPALRQAKPSGDGPGVQPSGALSPCEACCLAPPRGSRWDKAPPPCALVSTCSTGPRRNRRARRRVSVLLLFACSSSAAPQGARPAS